eukprot:scaffold3490_cov35-Prasinocladus_malaysianus.AAC.2
MRVKLVSMSDVDPINRPAQRQHASHCIIAAELRLRRLHCTFIPCIVGLQLQDSSLRPYGQA